MGGAAILIKGSVDAQRLEPPSGFFARLFGAKGPKEFPMGGDRSMVDLPSRDLKVLEAGFLAWLRARLASPWPASKTILDYLDMRTTTIHLRGEREGAAETGWYVQLTFSGCAGMAQTSADLAAHWVQRWFEADRERIDGLLRARGFVARDTEVAAESELFLPLGEPGYAGFSPEGFDAGDGRRSHFSFDAAIDEADDAQAQRLQQVLDAQFVALMRDGRCRCQLCAPEFDLAAIDGLPKVA